MKFFSGLAVACLLATNTSVLAHPQPVSDVSTERREAFSEAENLFAPVSDLYKRKGGGGGGGKGGGGSSGSSGKGGSSTGGSSTGGTTGYVPTFIQGEGGVHSKCGGREMAAGVGSSTSVRERYCAARVHAVGRDLSKPAAGEVKDISLRPRRFGGFAGIPIISSAGRTSRPSSSKSGHGSKMGPSSGHRLPDSYGRKDDANKPSSSGGRGSSSSNVGGSTRTGSGPSRGFGGGSKYGGGAAVPYSAGARSPRGIAPVFLGVGLLAVFPGLWLYGAYSYPYYNNYSFRNRTSRRNTTDTNTTNTPTRGWTSLLVRQDDDSGMNESKPVTCLCAAYASCGCDDDGNYTFLDSIIGDGDYNKLNHTLVTVADVNGTSTILLNGTLPNGTTAPGGTEEANSDSSTSGSGNTNAAVRQIMTVGGYWVMIATVGLTCFVI